MSRATTACNTCISSVFATYYDVSEVNQRGSEVASTCMQDTCISRVFELVLSVSRVYQLKYLDTCIIRVFELYLLHLKQIHVSGRTDTRYMYSKVCSDVSDMY